MFKFKNTCYTTSIYISTLKTTKLKEVFIIYTYIDENKKEVEIASEIISGKWKALILWNFNFHETIRFNEFKKLIPDITHKMLTQQLKALICFGVIKRTVHDTTPITVEYSLTPLGKDIMPLINEMHTWGEKFLVDFRNEESNRI